MIPAKSVHSIEPFDTRLHCPPPPHPLPSKTSRLHQPKDLNSLPIPRALCPSQPPSSHSPHLVPLASSRLLSPNRLHRSSAPVTKSPHQHRPTIHPSPHPKYQVTYLKPASTVCCVVCPSSFSSRLMRVAAAESPMNSAKMGSATREIRYVGGGIVVNNIRRWFCGDVVCVDFNFRWHEVLKLCSISAEDLPTVILQSCRVLGV
jgi:hypothetical protein